MIHCEKQYLNLVKKIIDTGFKEKGRNGNTLSLIGEQMRFSLKDNKLPLFTLLLVSTLLGITINGSTGS